MARIIAQTKNAMMYFCGLRSVPMSRRNINVKPKSIPSIGFGSEGKKSKTGLKGKLLSPNQSLKQRSILVMHAKASMRVINRIWVQDVSFISY
jgi:hypothetical protein